MVLLARALNFFRMWNENTLTDKQKKALSQMVSSEIFTALKGGYLLDDIALEGSEQTNHLFLLTEDAG